MGKKSKCIEILTTMVILLVMLGIFSDSVKAQNLVTYNLSVNFNKNNAQQLFGLINEWRSSTDKETDLWYYPSSDPNTLYYVNPNDLCTLQYDYFLEEIAMQRAVEYIFNTSHKRPDGSAFSTLYGDYNGYKGECLGYSPVDYTDAEFMLTDENGWREDYVRTLADNDSRLVNSDGTPKNTRYGLSSHRTCLLNTNYRSIGIACVVYEGKQYWAVEFGSLTPRKTTPNNITNPSTRQVTIDTDYKSGSSSYKLQVDLLYQMADAYAYYGQIGVPNPTVTVKFGSRGAVLSSDQYTVNWESSDESIAKINGNSIELMKPGEVTLTANVATNAGGFTGSAKTKLNIKQRDISDATFGGVIDQTYTGSEIYAEPIVLMEGKTLVKDVDYEIAYEGDDYITCGIKHLIIEGKGNFKGNKQATYNIVPADISDVQIDYTDRVTYNGKYQNPSISVSYNGTSLKKDVDAKVSDYSFKDAGNYVITFEGIGNFTGTTNINFEIEPLDIGGFKIGSIPNAVYTGQEIEPSVTLRNGNDEIDPKYYDVGYENNIVPGTATVTVTGKGNYSGTVSSEFTILPKDISSEDVFVEEIDSYTFTGNPIMPDPDVFDKDTELALNTDYELSYGENLNVGEGSITIIGKGSYTGHRTVTFEIDPKDISNMEVAGLDDEIYTGEEITSSFAISGLTSEDYDVTYENNINVGTASLTIEGKGNYCGKIEGKTFNIIPHDINNLFIEEVEDKTYTGEALTPDIVIKYGEYVLIENTDYETEFSNNINVGMAKVKITGLGNYSGTMNRAFAIKCKPCDEFAVESIDDMTYTGEELTCSVVIKDGEKVLSEGNDYELLFEDNTEKGDAKVTITFIGNYVGEKETSFKILAKPVDDLTIDEIGSYLYTGDAFTPEIKVYDDDKELTADTDYTVSYSDNVEPGDAKITVKGEGNYTGEKVFTFKIQARDISELSVDEVLVQEFTGEPIEPSVTIRFGETILDKDDYDISYENNTDITSDESVAYAVIVGKGTYTGTKRIPFRICSNTVYDLTIEGYSDVVYSGEAHTPNVVVKDGDVTLTKDTDYELQYEDNTMAGIAKIIIKGIGSYGGTLVKEFNIAKCDISAMTVSGIPVSETYTSEAIEPEISITGLENIRDYEVSYESNIDKGTASVIITGKGNYEGQIEKTFEINAASIDGATVAEIADIEYNGEAIVPDLDVKFKELALSVDDDYEIEIDNNTNVGKIDFKINGKGNFDGTKELSFNIVPMDISDLGVEEIENQEYTGSQITPEVKVMFGEQALKDSDFDLSYGENIKVSKNGTVTITGKGNFTGELTAYFTIVPKSLENFTVEGIENKLFTGSHITQTMTVKDGEKVLVKGLDYDVTYGGNTDVGDETYVIEGKNDYTGTIEGSFKITARDIGELNIIEIPDMTYTGSALIPDIDIEYNGRILMMDTDYTIEITGNKDVGEVAFKIVGCGNFQGEKEASFKILPRSADELVFEEIPAMNYTGSELAPSVVIKDGDKVLKQDEDYTIECSDLTSVGSKQITVTFKGNYSGEETLAFEIRPKSAENLTVEGLGTYEFTGSPITPAVVVKDGDTVLAENDYKITYENNTNAGKEAIVRVNGRGNYDEKTSAVYKFEITAKDIEDFTLSGISETPVTFTGSAITFDLKLTDGEQDLTTSDYDVTYSGNVNVGTATVKVTGKGNYKGTITKTFTINKKDISDFSSYSLGDREYTGGYICPSVSVKYGTVAMKENTDYKVSFGDNKAIGKAYIEVKGIGNYEGSFTIYFNIVAKNVTGLSYSSISDQTYTGKEIKPSLTVKNGNLALKEGTDYKLTYKNNVKAGTATITVTGIGNYKGTKDITFKIKNPPPTPSPSPSPTVTQAPTPAPVSDGKEQIRGFVERLYRNVLGREPEKQGADWWTDNLYSFSNTGAEAANLFITSQEFKDRNTSNDEFLNILYKTFFNRDPDQAGKDYWMSQLTSGAMSREAVANSFIMSQEWADTCAQYGIRSGGVVKPTVNIKPTSLTYGFVERLYTTALGRTYDQGGLDYWAGLLSNFDMTGEQAGAFFFLSEEMEGYNLSDEEYLERLYMTFMDRPSDAGGKKFWLDSMKSGLSRKDVVYGFTRSPEFVDKCVESRILPY